MNGSARDILYLAIKSTLEILAKIYVSHNKVLSVITITNLCFYFMRC